MRPAMRTLFCGLLLAGIAPLIMAEPASAGRPTTGQDVVALLQEERESGRIDLESYLLEGFRYVFAPERANPRYIPEERTLLKCFTPFVMEFQQSRDRLTEQASAEMEGYLSRGRSAGMRASYISPTGLFSFTYFTSGGNAVPSADVDPVNGIPDRVERCAEYADFSWDTEITTLGFMAPNLPGDGSYDMSFQSMGAYGYTTTAGGGLTEIVLHNTFVGFPANTDPDGNQLGAAKVTVAHEFKHASQHTNSNWSEGGWVELDATWVEDIVYDQTNDYYNYINFNFSNSQLSDPDLRLDNGGTGSYEDCLWQHYLSEKFGTQIIVDLWDIRAANPTQSMKSSYRDAMAGYSTTWDQSWPEMYEWCWFTGSRAEPPYGFGESTSYKRMNLVAATVSSYPYSVTGNVDQLSAHPRRFNPGSATGSPRIIFNGDDAFGNFTVSVIAEDPDGNFTVVRPALDANNDVDYTVPVPFSSLAYVGVIVTNSKRSGGTAGYSLDVIDQVSTGVTVTSTGGTDRLTLAPNSPNPFSASTRIGFTVPVTGRGSIRIYDVSGRVVRTLADGRLPAGTSEMVWDGLDAAGRQVPAGVYWSRIETARGSVARKMTVIR